MLLRKHPLVEIIRKVNPLAFPLVGGVLLALSYNVPLLWWLSFFALFLFLHFLYSTETPKRIVLGSFLFGLLFIGGTLIWFWDTLPLDWLGIEGLFLGSILVLVSWLAVSFLLALSISLVALLFFRLEQGTFIDVLLIPSLWVLFEYARAWGFAALTYGAESLLGPHFSIGFLGYLLAPNHNLLQFASLGGVYLLSFITVFISSFFYWLFFRTQLTSRRRNSYTAAALVFLAVVVWVPLGGTHAEELERHTPNAHIALLNTYFSSSLTVSVKERSRRLSTYEDLIATIAAGDERPDIIVFPEDARFTQILDERGLLKTFFSPLSKNKEVLIIDSSRTFISEGEARSRASFYTTGEDSIETYDKQFLVPQGEYAPLLYQLFLRGIGRSDITETFESNRSYTKGSEIASGSYQGAPIGALFCSELFSPELYDDLVKEESAQFLVNMSSQSIFHGSIVLRNQTINTAKVRAVENNRYLAQASNFLPSFVVSNRGEVVAISENEENSVLFAPVFFFEQQSFHTLLRNWILVLALLLVVSTGLLQVRSSWTRRGAPNTAHLKGFSGD